MSRLTDIHTQDAFDARARACYQQASAAVPPQVRFKLRPQPVSPVRAKAPARGWWLGGGLATAALALALGLTQMQPNAPEPATASLASTVQAAGDDNLTLLGGNPDFFAWLGSDDVHTMAME